MVLAGSPVSHTGVRHWCYNNARGSRGRGGARIAGAGLTGGGPPGPRSFVCVCVCTDAEGFRWDAVAQGSERLSVLDGFGVLVHDVQTTETGFCVWFLLVVLMLE